MRKFTLIPTHKNMLHSLCYISNAKMLWPKFQLNKLYSFCKQRNKIIGITGVLIYDEGTFIEVLEGEKANVSALFSKIKKDDRHDHITVMLKTQIEHRIFHNFYTASRYVSNQKLLDSLELELQQQESLTYSKKLQAIFKPFSHPLSPLLPSMRDKEGL